MKELSVKTGIHSQYINGYGLTGLEINKKNKDQACVSLGGKLLFHHVVKIKKNVYTTERKKVRQGGKKCDREEKSATRRKKYDKEEKVRQGGK